MKISYNWLKNYINTEIDYKEVAKILTSIGLEVESIDEFQSVKGGLKGIVIGKVIEKEKHPDADKLSVTKVDIGTGQLLNIVCGAPNVAAGQTVVVATLGTILYKGEESFEIKRAKIRGIESEGMICAEDEIGLGTSHAGIMVLPDNIIIGTSAAEYFKVENDFIFEIGITPNRADATSHIGVARDLYAFLKNHSNEKEKVKLIKPNIDNFKTDNHNLYIPVVLENMDACPRYSGLTISGITVKESPVWLKNKLLAIGQRPINNIVDITNFVLHEMGQPLHAFDASMILGNKVVIKTLNDGTPFQTLDEIERKLSAEDLMICNEQEGMCIAGVFGGTKSGVTEKTKNIFLESAYFNPVFVRKTSKRHDLHTDSAFRFERGTDPNITVYALKRAALLIKENAGGEISSEIVDVYPKPIENFRVQVSYKNIDRLIGKVLQQEIIKNILKSLEIEIINETPEGLTIDVPPYRVDVKREADVVEDILRIYGYNNIEIPTVVNSTLSYAPKPDAEKLQNKISDFLSSIGFNETMCNSLTKSVYYDNLDVFPSENLVKILNPLSNDLNSMRQTLLFGGLESLKFNINYKNGNLKIYEFGNCYFHNSNRRSIDSKSMTNYAEEFHLLMLISGENQNVNWTTKSKPTDFYYLKSYTENVLTRFGYDLNLFTIKEIENDIYFYGLQMSINNVVIAEFGEIRKKLLKSFEIEQPVFYSDFYWFNMLKNIPETVRYKEIINYPEVKRDLALLLDNHITFEKVKEIAFRTEKKLLRKISIFDVYRGDNLGIGKKSYAISYILQDEKKSLTDKEIDNVIQKLINAYQKELGATIR